jgi:hypothetical protein
MVIFNSYVKLPEGIPGELPPLSASKRLKFKQRRRAAFFAAPRDGKEGCRPQEEGRFANRLKGGDRGSDCGTIDLGDKYVMG